MKLDAERGRRNYITAQVVSLSRRVSGLSNAQRAISSLRRIPPLVNGGPLHI